VGLGATDWHIDHLPDVFPMPIDAIILKVKLAVAETGWARCTEGPLKEIIH
jgi:hypothetical protein